MNDATQAYVNVIVATLDKMTDDTNLARASRADALQLIARRVMRIARESAVNPLIYADPEWLAEWTVEWTADDAAA